MKYKTVGSRAEQSARSQFTTSWWSGMATMAIAVLMVGACGGSAAEVTTVPLSANAQAGLELARAAGCAPCHGSNGEGVDGLGSAFVGLFGTRVTLEDGTSVLADRDYLRRAITDPEAEVVPGYGSSMPGYELPAEDLETILDYLEEVR